MLTAIRITDPHVIALVESEQERSGEGTATKTAARLIIERLAQKEIEDLRQRAASPEKHSAPAA